MSYIKQMFETHPVNPSSDHEKVIECITACYSCLEAYNACADACLGEKDVAQMVQCIRDCNDCADVCLATARIISRFTRTDFKLAGAQLRACIQACRRYDAGGPPGRRRGRRLRPPLPASRLRHRLERRPTPLRLPLSRLVLLARR